MTEIRSINLNTPSISNPSVSEKPAKEEKENTQVQPEVKSEKPQVSEKDLFSFMANGAVVTKVNIKLTPGALVAKYNSPEQIARIQASVLDADKAVDEEDMARLDEEFADVPAYQNMSLANRRAFALALRMGRVEGNPSVSKESEAIGNMFADLTDSVVEGLAGY